MTMLNLIVARRQLLLSGACAAVAFVFSSCRTQDVKPSSGAMPVEAPASPVPLIRGCKADSALGRLLASIPKEPGEGEAVELSAGQMAARDAELRRFSWRCRRMSCMKVRWRSFGGMWMPVWCGFGGMALRGLIGPEMVRVPSSVLCWRMEGRGSGFCFFIRGLRMFSVPASKCMSGRAERGSRYRTLTGLILCLMGKSPEMRRIRCRVGCRLWGRILTVACCKARQATVIWIGIVFFCPACWRKCEGRMEVMPLRGCMCR